MQALIELLHCVAMPEKKVHSLQNVASAIRTLQSSLVVYWTYIRLISVLPVIPTFILRQRVLKLIYTR